MKTRLFTSLVAALTALVVAGTASAGNSEVRFATFNASLNRNFEGQLIDHLSTPANAQARAVAEIIQRTRPEVLLINEFDFDAAGTAARLFQQNYLSVSQNGAAPIQYPYVYQAPSNTGVASEKDLDNNGVVDTVPDPAFYPADGYAGDAYGFGEFPGQFGMLVLSQHPIVQSNVRTFQTFLWKDMPGNLIPTPFYSPDEVAILRLSSKSHWDVPIRIGGKVVHFLASHPTPPVFDGPEDRNGRRNFDEIRFWADYVTPGRASRYIYDDAGERGGLKPGSLFVIAGDQNSDPFDGDSIPGSAQLLLEHPLVNTKVTPSSEGGVEAAAEQGLMNETHVGDPAFDTADFCDFPAFPPCSGPGNLRADYVLPRKSLRIADAGIFWPWRDDPFFYLTGPGFPVPSSDHRLVWIDVSVPGTAAQR